MERSDERMAVMSNQQVRVAVVMGSTSDWEQMQAACDVLDKLQITYEKRVVSAHRMPNEMFQFGKEASSRGLQVIIAGAGGAAHLPGMLASQTTLPVIGVPIKTSTLSGVDSLLSIVQMPGGVPVGTMSIGQSGAKNAGLQAARILSLTDSTITERLSQYTEQMRQLAIESERELYD